MANRAPRATQPRSRHGVGPSSRRRAATRRWTASTRGSAASRGGEICEPRRLDEDAVEARLGLGLGEQRVHEVSSNRAADAPGVEEQHVLAHLLDEQVVERHRSELVHHDQARESIGPRSARFRSVVFPEPRKPVRMVIGTVIDRRRAT
jgi:hypothetical protein